MMLYIYNDARRRTERERIEKLPERENGRYHILVDCLCSNCSVDRADIEPLQRSHIARAHTLRQSALGGASK